MKQYIVIAALLLTHISLIRAEEPENSSPQLGEVAATPTGAYDAPHSAPAWDDANALYAEGNYQDAIAAYEAIIAADPTPEAYYNLGNAYFKTGEVALSILAYERSLRLRPRDKNTLHNLQFAQARIIDNIEDNHRFFLANWAESFRNLLPEYRWFRLSVGLFILMLISAFLFAFGRGLVLRKVGFHTAWVALLCSVISLWCAASLHHRDTAREEAIVVQGIVNAKSSPDKSGTDLFILHEGTKVWVKDNVNGWCEIHVGDNIGWVRNTTIERI